jgi:hypothetical protein
MKKVVYFSVVLVYNDSVSNKAHMTNEDEVLDMMTEALYLYQEEYGSDDPDESIGIRTYDEVGMLTRDTGFVLSIGDRRFQVTIVEA